MAEDDRSQLPLPSPGSPAEKRKQRKSTSELRETSEETYELRKTADGEYEKKTTKSERHERKTSDEETFVAAGLPSPTVSLTGWHEQVPERAKLEVSGVTAEGCPEAPSLDADYILDLLDRRPERCRWEYTFRAKCQLFRCCLEAYPSSDGTLTLRAFFEGSVAGPAWTQTGLRDLSGRVMLSFDHASAENPCAGCRWPETLTATPLAAPAATKRFYISPEPTQHEMAAMASSGSISSSAGRRKIIMIGYWPPTGIQGMLAKWKDGVLHEGFHVRSYSAIYPKNPPFKQGAGNFRTDYQVTSQHFWKQVKEDRPIAIMGFGREEDTTDTWRLELSPRNLSQASWVDDYVDPKKPAGGATHQDVAPPNKDWKSQPGLPPDAEKGVTSRGNNLPEEAIRTKFETAVPSIQVITGNNAGKAVCEYLAYHLGWYQEWSQTQEFPKCEIAGFVHVAENISPKNGTTAVEAQLDAVIEALEE